MIWASLLAIYFARAQHTDGRGWTPTVPVWHKLAGSQTPPRALKRCTLINVTWKCVKQAKTTQTEWNISVLSWPIPLVIYISVFFFCLTKIICLQHKSISPYPEAASDNSLAMHNILQHFSFLKMQGCVFFWLPLMACCDPVWPHHMEAKAQRWLWASWQSGLHHCPAWSGTSGQDQRKKKRILKITSQASLTVLLLHCDVITQISSVFDECCLSLYRTHGYTFWQHSLYCCRRFIV